MTTEMKTARARSTRTAGQSCHTDDRRIVDDFVRAMELEEQAADYAAAGEIRRAARSQLADDRSRCRAQRARSRRMAGCGVE